MLTDLILEFSIFLSNSSGFSYAYTLGFIFAAPFKDASMFWFFVDWFIIGERFSFALVAVGICVRETTSFDW